MRIKCISNFWKDLPDDLIFIPGGYANDREQKIEKILMNRSKYFDSIEFNLSLLATRIEKRGGLNILDLHVHSESFYLHFFNVLFGWELKNLNFVQKNVAGIDLFDPTNNILVQVSATATKQKIESAQRS